MMIFLSPVLTLVVIFLLTLMIFFASVVGKKSASAFREQQKKLGALKGYIEEMMEGQKVVKVFNRQEKCNQEFSELNDALCENGIRAHTLANILGPSMNNFSHIQYAIIAIIGAIRVIHSSMDIGSIAAFLQYTRSFSRPISMMSQQLNSVLNALAGAERIFAVIDENAEIDEGKIT